MGHLGRLTKTPYLVLFVVLGAVGVTAVSAAVLVTVDNLTITGDMTCPGCVDSADIAPNAVQTTNIADGSITSDDLAPGVVPPDVSNQQCATGNIVVGFDITGNAICKSAFIPTSRIAHLDVFGLVGKYSSVAIGSDGNPVISYLDNTNIGTANTALKVAHCDDPYCFSYTTNTVDATNLPGFFTSITIAPDNNPIISYSRIPTLVVAHCIDLECSSANISDISFDVLGFGVGDEFTRTSIAIGSDGLPIISYADGLVGGLGVVHCNGYPCTSPSITRYHEAGSGFYSSLAINSDGNPAIVHWSSNLNKIRMVLCDNPACTSAVLKDIDGIGTSVGQHLSLTIGTDNNPIMSYLSLPANDLEIAHCNDVTCSSISFNLIEGEGRSGEFTSIAILPNGKPVISHWSLTLPGLVLTKCQDVSCSTVKNIILDTGNGLSVGKFTSIAIGSDGRPVISYYDESQTALKFLKHGLFPTLK